MDTNTVQVIEKIGSKLNDYIAAIATKAGVAADHFYPIFVKQQAIEGWAMLIVIAAGIVIAFSLLRMGVQSVQDSNDNRSPTQEKSCAKCLVGFIGGTIVTLMLLIAGTSNIFDAVGKINNPEYYAVQSLVKMVK